MAADLGVRFRMTGGNIRRTAQLARAEAALAGREQPVAEDVMRGARAQQARLLDTLAARVPTVIDWDRVAVRPETMRELRLLEVRCRHRERIATAVGAAASQDLTAGVRALLTGPSGTGKTLAARTLAGVLGVDLYRIDLSTVVNKYLGETEKNLDRLFSRAEESDAALLLDEGDALMTRRTDVQTSNDRYANLETNFLLQRLESFDGIVLITTNAADRIDDAFRRRMDVVIDFGLPDELERWSIWRLHLPDSHAVGDDLVEELAVRCALSGGQMRNAVLHASLLALQDGGTICSEHLEAAVRREYQQAGQVCPLAAEVPIA
jgi:SpoVK/Ycf46/Vps4 family AAA+-type ATPase